MTKEKRFEYKFRISPDELSYFYYWMKERSVRYEEVFPKRIVHNIYFDSPDYRNIQDNISGISERVKCRVRWYDPDKPFQFELKAKKDSLVNKWVQQFDRSIIHSSTELHHYIESNLGPQLLHQWRKTPVPSLYNQYSREYFLINGNIRLTFDTNLSFAKNHIRSSISRASFTIIEIKFDPSNKSVGDSFISQMPFRTVKYSKYLGGVTQLFDLSF
ncbi:VTC domain-containing protein [Bacteriovoracaceae bacterium]|nr:VTC domain-containing protein [Bacteriovoracaceae bacterium]